MKSAPPCMLSTKNKVKKKQRNHNRNFNSRREIEGAPCSGSAMKLSCVHARTTIKYKTPVIKVQRKEMEFKGSRGEKVPLRD